MNRSIENPGQAGISFWRRRLQVSCAASALEPVPRPARDAEAVRHIIRRALIAGHGCGGRPGEIIVQHLPQSCILVQTDIGQRLIEAGDCATIHFLVLPVATVGFDDARLVTAGAGIDSGATKGFGPVRSESPDMVGMEAVAEGMADHFVGHDSTMPGVGETAQAVHSACGFENSLHGSIMQSCNAFCKVVRPKNRTVS